MVSTALFGEACLGALLQAVEGIERPVVGLPTGNTPVALYEALRKLVQSGGLDVSGWSPFAIDEYGGPKGHPCSNRSFFARYWDAMPGAPSVAQFDPEASNPTEETNQLSEALELAGGLDVSLLGIGLNGHLAFNEPGSDFDSGVRRVDLTPASIASGARCWGSESPMWGLTLGLRQLLGAPAVIVMANGPEKAGIVARAIRGAESPACPASFVRRVSRAVWVLDKGAAGAL